MSSIYVSALYTYPVKSCAGILYKRAELVERGLRYDRQWMVVNATNKFITQRENPQMALVQKQLTNDELILTAPDLPPLHISLAEYKGEKRDVVVWKDTCQAVDEGETAARWFTKLLHTEAVGTDAGIVRAPDQYRIYGHTWHIEFCRWLSFIIYFGRQSGRFEHSSRRSRKSICIDEPLSP